MLDSIKSIKPLSILKRDWRTVPNLVTMCRLGLAIVAIVLIACNTPWLWPLLLVAIAAATDKLDGWLAKKLDQKTELGAFLDPAVDKILVLGVLMALLCVAVTHANGLAWWIGAVLLLIVVREVDVASVKKTITLRRGKLESASRSGRFSMFVQCLAVLVLLSPLPDAYKQSALIFAVLASYNSWLDYRLELRQLRKGV